MRSFLKSLDLNWPFLAVFFYSFSLTLFFRFQYHNDLGFWYSHDFGPHPETGHLFFFGRPLGGFLLDIQTNILRIFPTLTVLTISRFLSLLLLGMFFFLVEEVLKRFTDLLPFQRSIFLIAMAIQPSWFEAYAWVSNLVPGVIAYIVGISSFIAYSNPVLSKWQRYIGAGSLIAAAFLIYPPGASVFFWGVLIRCSLGKDDYTLKQVILDGLYFALICLLALAFHKFFVMDYVCGSYWTKCETWEAPDSKTYSWSLMTNPIEKLGILWNLTIVTSISWITILKNVNIVEFLPGIFTILFALGPYSNKGDRKFTVKHWIRGLGYGLMFIFVLNAPNLVTNSSVIAFRTVAPYTIFIALGLIKILSLFKDQKIQKILSVCIGLALITLCIASSLKLASHYSNAWTSISSNTEVIKICKDHPKTSTQLAQVPVVAKYLEPRYFTDADSLDLDFPLLLKDLTPAICDLLDSN